MMGKFEIIKIKRSGPGRHRKRNFVLVLVEAPFDSPGCLCTPPKIIDIHLINMGRAPTVPGTGIMWEEEEAEDLAFGLAEPLLYRPWIA